MCLGLVFLSPQPHLADFALTSVLAAPFLAGAIALSARLWRGRIVASASGLRWHNGWRERQARWEDVTDYYYLPPPARNSPVIVTRAGQLMARDWTHGEELLCAVSERARRARAKTWDIQGLRLEDEWPRSFRYDARAYRGGMWLFVATLILSPLRVFCNSTPAQFASTIALMWRWSGPAVTMGLLLTLALIILLQPFLILALVGPRWRQARTQHGESFLASPEGLTWLHGATSRTIHWSEVTSYALRSTGTIKTPNVYIVEAGGERMEWTCGLNGYAALARIAQRFATNAATKEWQEAETIEAAYLAEARRQMTGEQVFTYHSNQTRALVWLICSMFALPALIEGISCFYPLRPSPPSGGDALFPAMLLAAVVWLWACYLTTKVTVSRSGVLQRSVFRSRFIAWGEMQPLAPLGESLPVFLHLRGRGVPIRIFTAITDVRLLHAAIAEHLALQNAGPANPDRPGL